MPSKIPKMCITCQHYEPYNYRCKLDGTYIGYLYCDELTKCKAYRLSGHYKKGGKFYGKTESTEEEKE